MLTENNSQVLALPALTTAHSHAFQRALRGFAQRPGPSGTDDFWSWRTAMYQLAKSITPESIYSISSVAYRELYQAGVRTVGEFHYIHHDTNGAPYQERTVLAEAVIRAALDAGLRIALLRVVYNRAGQNKAPEGAQLRFSDKTLEHVFEDLDTLRKRYNDHKNVQIGIAPHSVRAVPPEWLSDIAAYATKHKLPLHMHVAEQPAEIDACLSETKRRPIELLDEKGILSERFVAVHATHLAPHEPKLLGNARAFVCLCPTTERDLGDGLPNVTELYQASVRLCTGVDSHVITQPLEDLRGIDLGERLRTLRRIPIRPSDRTPAEELWYIGSQLAAEACGFSDPGGMVSIDKDAMELALVPEEKLLDAIVYSGSNAVFLPETKENS